MMESRDRLVVSLEGASWIHELSREVEIAGRGPAADLHLDDAKCSRRHLRLTRAREGLRFEDLGTLNGTLLNGAPARDGMLKDGDVLEIGRARLTYRRVSEGDRGAARGLDLLLTCGESSQLYEMGKAEILIGRDPRSDLRLEDPTCSRRQARLLQSPDGLKVENFGSLNPTLLNGAPVWGSAPVAPGDRLSFGRAELRILLPEGGVPTPEGVTEPQRSRRILLTRRAEESRSLLVPAAAAAAAAVLLIWIALGRTPPPPPAPPPPPKARAPAPPKGAGAAEALAGAREAQAVRPEDHEAAIRRFHDVARAFPGTPEASEAMAAARAARSLWEADQDAQLEGTLEAAKELAAAGMPRLARNVLTGFLEGGSGSPERFLRIQARLRELDAETERGFQEAASAALALAREGRFEEARTRMRAERVRLLGLPWGSAAEAKLREIDALEASAETARAGDERRRREEADRSRSEEERVRRREAWVAGQKGFAARLERLSPGDRKGRDEAFEALMEHDPGLEPFVVDAIRRAHGRLLKDMEVKLRSPEVQGLQKGLKGDLEERRKAALGLILDEARYPYHPGKANRYGPDGAKVQAEVDRLVLAVEEAYRPARGLVRAVRALKGFDALFADVEEMERDLKRCGHPLAREATLAGLMDRRLKVDFSREEDLDRASALVLDLNEKTAAALIREGKLDADEARCILVTNRYRILMGLSPVRIEASLGTASRFHSKDMAARGYFAHVDPDGKTHADRAREAGFKGMGCGENITQRQSAEEAFESWRHSSGHHRNMLSPHWTQIGVGRSGIHWTMMLGL